jgi:hypothetical protein
MGILPKQGELILFYHNWNAFAHCGSGRLQHGFGHGICTFNAHFKHLKIINSPDHVENGGLAFEPVQGFSWGGIAHKIKWGGFLGGGL